MQIKCQGCDRQRDETDMCFLAAGGVYWLCVSCVAKHFSKELLEKLFRPKLEQLTSPENHE